MRNKFALVAFASVAIASWAVCCVWPLIIERRIENQFAAIEFRYNHGQDEWCVDAQRVGHSEFVGGCWKTLREAEEGILRK